MTLTKLSDGQLIAAGKENFMLSFAIAMYAIAFGRRIQFVIILKGDTTNGSLGYLFDFKFTFAVATPVGFYKTALVFDD